MANDLHGCESGCELLMAAAFSLMERRHRDRGSTSLNRNNIRIEKERIIVVAIRCP